MNAFIFKSAHYDQAEKNIILQYAYSNGLSFTEIVHFPNAKTGLSNEENKALKKAVRALHLAAGISYYKAYCPNEIRIETEPLTREESDFFNKFYLMGLGEFAVENKIVLNDVIKFPFDSTKQSIASDLVLPNESVVPIGGGKDSIVSLETLSRTDHPYRMIAINAGKPIKDVMKIGGRSNSILITRKLDPSLFDLNDKGTMNGHVPITGILSFIIACGAILYGYDSVVMSNEGSASEGNVEFAGIDVNHQYSKSLEFELDFDGFIKTHVLKDFKYFSLLRPLTETGIACLFSTLPQYFDYFKSCNRNFHIDKGVRQYGWCCDCPKCRFVFLALSPFINKQELIQIFGKNMLDDKTQEDGFRELVGLKGHKPFECVGEIEECQQIIKCLTTTDWASDYLVALLASELNTQALNQDELKKLALSLNYDHNIPEEYLEYLNDFIRTQG